MSQKLVILIILSWIKLEKVILVRSEISVLFIRSVSSKTESETMSYIWDFSTKHWVRKSNISYDLLSLLPVI